MAIAHITARLIPSTCLRPRRYGDTKNFLSNVHACRDITILPPKNFTVNRGDCPYSNSTLQLCTIYQSVSIFEYGRPIKGPSSDARDQVPTPGISFSLVSKVYHPSVLTPEPLARTHSSGEKDTISRAYYPPIQPTRRYFFKRMVGGRSMVYRA